MNFPFLPASEPPPLALALISSPAFAQTARGQGCRRATRSPRRRSSTRSNTKLIKQHLQDPRITTEYVDHMPASDTVPSPLKFFGTPFRALPASLTLRQGHPIAITKALFQGLAARESFWKIRHDGGKGRDQVLLAIADEATIKDLDKYKDIAAKLRRSRKVSDDQARELIKNPANPSIGRTKRQSTRRRPAGRRC